MNAMTTAMIEAGIPKPVTTCATCARNIRGWCEWLDDAVDPGNCHCDRHVPDLRPLGGKQ